MCILDVKDFLDRVADDQTLLMELLGDFEKYYLKDKKLLDKAIDKEDFQEIETIAHRMKGAAGNISVQSMYTSCMIIEQLASNNEIDLIKELSVDLSNQYDELCVYIAELKHKKNA